LRGDDGRETEENREAPRERIACGAGVLAFVGTGLVDGRAAVLLREDVMSRPTARWLAAGLFFVGLPLGIWGLRRIAADDALGWIFGIIGFAAVLLTPVISSKGEDPAIPS
jgi:hypothetical protein